MPGASIALNPDYTGFNNPSVNDDAAIITLSEPLPDWVPTYDILRDVNTILGAEIIMVGYGLSGYGNIGVLRPNGLTPSTVSIDLTVTIHDWIDEVTGAAGAGSLSASGISSPLLATFDAYFTPLDAAVLADPRVAVALARIAAISVFADEPETPVVEAAADLTDVSHQDRGAPRFLLQVTRFTAHTFLTLGTATENGFPPIIAAYPLCEVSCRPSPHCPLLLVRWTGQLCPARRQLQ